MVEIWKHWPEYPAARQQVLDQSLEADLRTIDNLFGRDRLNYGDDAAAVKREALRQLEIEFRSERDEAAEFWVLVAQSTKPTP